MSREARAHALPFDVTKAVTEGDVRKLLMQVIKAAQENFDSISGDQRAIVAEFNRLADDVASMSEYLNAQVNAAGDVESFTGAGEVSHDELEDVSANDHHNQAHDQGDHNIAEVGDLVAVAATADAGTSVEVPNADHRHAHGTGYAGGHTDSAAAFDDATSNPLAVGTTADGVENSPARKDHVHATGAGTPSAVSTANATGSGPAAAMTDHVHAHEAAHVAHDTVWDAKGDLVSGSAADTAVKTAVGADDTILMADAAASGGIKWVASATPSAVTPDAAAAAGSSDDFSRASHQHGVATYSSTAAAVGTAAAGTSGFAPSRGDHVHPTGAGTPSTQAFGDAADVGTGPAAAMTDHKHAMPADPVTAHAAASDPHTGYVLESLLDAKGDLIAASADNTPSKVTVGTDGKVLTADSAATGGVSWQTSSGGGTGSNLYLVRSYY